jgi:hypothetical protein
MVSRLPQNGFICCFFDPVSCPVLALLAESGGSAEAISPARVRRSGEKQ